jgi:CHRD domain
MTYKVDIKDIDKVTMAQIHQGIIGENGPVVVTLFKAPTPTDPKNGLLAQGSVTLINLKDH